MFTLVFLIGIGSMQGGYPLTAEVRDMNVQQAAKLFLKWVERNRASRTLEAYRERLSAVVDVLKARQLSRLKLSHIEQALHHAGNNGHGTLSADTRRLNAVVVEQLQKWALSHGHLKKPWFDRLEKPPGRRRDRTPTEDEQRQLLEVASDEFRRIFLALRLCGARPSELCSADIADYDESRNLILLNRHKMESRTSRSRKIGVGYRLRDILRASTSGRAEGPLFLDEHGLRWRVNQLSARYRRYREKAGLSKELVLYSATRHEHGTRVTRKLGIHAAAHSLGHSSISSTMRYLHPDDRDLAKYQDDVFDF